MPKHRTNRVLRHKVAVGLREALRVKGLTVAAAAKRLGVTRQTVWLYLNEKAMPGGRVLERACRNLDLAVNVDGFHITKDVFGPKVAPAPLPKQHELFRVLAEIKPEQIETTLVPSSKDLFELRVKVKKAS